MSFKRQFAESATLAYGSRKISIQRNMHIAKVSKAMLL